MGGCGTTSTWPDGNCDSTSTMTTTVPNWDYPWDTCYNDGGSEVRIRVQVYNTITLPAGYWAMLEVYKLVPHQVPAYFEKAPRKIEFKSEAPGFIHKKIKQPVSRSGFKRGQRNEL